ncbi:MAG: hypothetical protein K2I18_06225 [Paramuribaculum sp.]|nr:hypothetical protein [Paramuribaculum sp.]
MMKKLVFAIAMIVAACTAKAATDLSAYRGVWSSNDAEAVITDSICIFYYQADSTMQAILAIPSADFFSKTIFSKDGKVMTINDSQSLDISKTDGELNIGGRTLKKVESINTVKPYEIEPCTSKFDVGKCLQQWRLGAGYGISDNMIYCEVNTNRHMFVYMVSPSMVYIRAAATRNNNNGTLFFQNIRMMKNQNTGEYTMAIVPDNFKVSRNDLEIDNTKFNPDACTFSPDGGIYWSLISFEPDLILLNGCGETYEVKRPPLSTDSEYFEYVPYSPEDKFLDLR